MGSRSSEGARFGEAMSHGLPPLSFAHINDESLPHALTRRCSVELRLVSTQKGIG